MKFKGRNGGMAVAMRNHIMLFRAFVISLLMFTIKNTDYIEGNRAEFIAWTKAKSIKVLHGY